MKEYIELFVAFAKVGALTFGGGYAMLPVLQREVSEKKKWATEEELMDYYIKGPRYNKIALVHGDMKYKPEFARTLQSKLGDNGNSAKVICVNEDTKIYF